MLCTLLSSSAPKNVLFVLVVAGMVSPGVWEALGVWPSTQEEGQKLEDAPRTHIEDPKADEECQCVHTRRTSAGAGKMVLWEKALVF